MAARSNPVISQKFRPIGVSTPPRSPEPEMRSPVLLIFSFCFFGCGCVCVCVWWAVYTFHFPGYKMTEISDKLVLGEAGRGLCVPTLES